ncbi:MAG TPA: TIGR04255 family protein [Nitrospirae bacterium]|nr:TIGR04255 family protein [Nitrospirota bacterium]
MNRVYSNPPIIEALCEFQFIPSQPWDLTIPGLIYEKVKDQFPDRQQQLGIGVQFTPTEKGIEHKIEPAPPRIQFHRRDKTALIQVAPDLLVVNQLRPYPKWENFKPLILNALQTYIEIVSPRGFKRIGLRYINKLNINDKTIEISDYLNFYPSVPEDIPSVYTNFICRVEVPYNKERDLMLLTVATSPPENQEVLSIVLDLDYILAKHEALSIGEVEDWLEIAHATIESTFESCITDKCRILFEEVRS